MSLRDENVTLRKLIENLLLSEEITLDTKPKDIYPLLPEKNQSSIRRTFSTIKKDEVFLSRLATTSAADNHIQQPKPNTEGTSQTNTEAITPSVLAPLASFSSITEELYENYLLRLVKNKDPDIRIAGELRNFLDKKNAFKDHKQNTLYLTEDQIKIFEPDFEGSGDEDLPPQEFEDLDLEAFGIDPKDILGDDTEFYDEEDGDYDGVY
jgi:hypothetical protein